MSDFPLLINRLVSHFYEGDGFSTIIQARKFAEGVLRQPVQEGHAIAKQVDEAIESAIVRTGRIYVQENPNPITLYDQMRDLYERQPNLRVRTSDSVLRQAYSTPIPISYTTAVLAGIDATKTVYEPTAGNGALLLLASPERTYVNEIDPVRAAQLREQGFQVTQHDALQYSLPHQVDVVLANPPFGSKQNERGRTLNFQHQKLLTTQVDHVIALKALDALAPNGKAVLILGSKLGDDAERAKRYSSQLTRGFYHWLYRDSGFRVTDHFSIDGGLYRKQGAGYPIDVVLIEGRGETDLQVPAIDVPRMYATYDELREVLVNAVERSHATQQAQRDTPITLRDLSVGQEMDPPANQSLRPDGDYLLDERSTPATSDSYRDGAGVPILTVKTPGVADLQRDPGVEPDLQGNSSTSGRNSDRSGNQLPTPNSLGDDAGDRPNSNGVGRSHNPDQFSSSPSVFPTTGTTIPPSSVSSNSGTRSDESLGMDGMVRFGSSTDIKQEAVAMSEELIQPDVETDPSDPLQEPDWEAHVDRQLPYVPRSKGFRLDTLSPSSAIEGLRQVFDRVESVTGLSVDEYVRERLKEPSLDSLFSHYAAEQIDSLALCIYNFEHEQKSTLVAHDTGLGKTRIIAGLARYAVLNDMIPVVVTADPVLYNDFLSRDAKDTGNEFNPFFTNNSLKMELKTPQGEVLGEIRTPDDHYKTVQQFTAQGSIGEHDCILTTYGQLTGSASQDRRALLDTLAPRVFLITDESHKAGGAAGVEQKRGKDQDDDLEKNAEAVPSVTEFFQELITKTPAFIASSATAIKDPIVAARLFYETTDLRYSAEDRDTFAAHLQGGGVPLQQMVFSMWAASGGFIRCQKSYEGVDFSLNRVKVNLQTAEDTSKALNAIWKFDKAKNIAVKSLDSEYKKKGQKAETKSNAVGEGGAQSTIFTSVLHNLIAAYNLAYVSDALADRVIDSIESGRKPVVMLFNTMETMVKDFVSTYNEAAQLHNLENPENPIEEITRNSHVPIKAGELAMRYLEKSRMVKLVDPYLNEATGKREVVNHRLTDEELGPYAVELYNRAKNAISAIPEHIPVSPIDYLKKRVEEAGYSIGEITGRSQMLSYSSTDLSTAVTTYTTRTASTRQKQKVMEDFQSGRLDAVITNSTTGYSLHAARNVDDQRQRCMLIPQPNPDINQVEQAIGRVHRANQVNPDIHEPDSYDTSGNPVYGKFPGTFGLPQFELIAGEGLPTSERQLAIVQRKMDVLKANTAGDRGSAFDFPGMPNFMDEFGCEVALRLMESDWMLHADLDYPLGKNPDELKIERAIQKVTGRAPMLVSDDPPTPECPYPSLARQAWLYDTLATDYRELLAQKQALGENTLEAQRLDLRARPLQRKVLNPGNPEIQSAFTEPTYLVEVMARTGRKPYTTLQVANSVRDAVGAEAIDSLEDHDDFERSDIRELGRSQASLRVEELSQLTQEFRQTHVEASQVQIAVQQGKIAKIQERLQAQEEIRSNLQSQVRALVGKTDEASVRQLTQLDGKLSVQEPKIEKLRGQLNDAQQTLNKRTADLDRLQKGIETQYTAVSNSLTTFPVGQGVRIVEGTKGNVLYGVVTGINHLKNTTNPVAPTSWKLNLAVVDGMRELTLKFDKLSANTSLSVIPVETAYGFSNPLEEMSIYDLFDDRQIQAEEKRYLVAGQVMATELTGTFAQVTDDKGNIHPVYLLNRGFDPEADLDKKMIAIATPEQAQWFLLYGSNRQGELATADENLKIRVSFRGDGQGLYLETPFAPSRGKKYFGDQKFLKLTGNFNSVKAEGKEYMVAHPPSDKTLDILRYAIDTWQLGANSHKNIAREITGKTLSSWQDCSTILPEDYNRGAILQAQSLPAIQSLGQEQRSDFSQPSQDYLEANSTTIEVDSVEVMENSTSTPSIAETEADSSILGTADKIDQISTLTQPELDQSSLSEEGVVATPEGISRQSIHDYPWIAEALKGWLLFDDWSTVQVGVEQEGTLTLYPADARTGETISLFAAEEITGLVQQHMPATSEWAIAHDEFSQAYAISVPAQEAPSELSLSDIQSGMRSLAQQPDFASQQVSEVFALYGDSLVQLWESAKTSVFDLAEHQNKSLSEFLVDVGVIEPVVAPAVLEVPRQVARYDTIKAAYPDALVFVPSEHPDAYLSCHQDAQVVAELTDLKLRQISSNAGEPYPAVYLPKHQLDNYLPQLQESQSVVVAKSRQNIEQFQKLQAAPLALEEPLQPSTLPQEEQLTLFESAAPSSALESTSNGSVAAADQAAMGAMRTEAMRSLIHPAIHQGLEWLTTNPQELASLGLGMARRIPHVVETDGFLSQADQRAVLTHLERLGDRLTATTEIVLPTPEQLEAFFTQCPTGIIRETDHSLQVHCPADSDYVTVLGVIAEDPEYAPFYQGTQSNAWVSKGQYWEFPLEATQRLQAVFHEFDFCTKDFLAQKLPVVAPQGAEISSLETTQEPASPSPVLIPEVDSFETPLTLGDRVSVEKEGQQVEGSYLGPARGTGSMRYDPDSGNLSELVRVQPDEGEVIRVFPHQLHKPGQENTAALAPTSITTTLGDIDPGSLSPVLLNYLEYKQQEPEALLLYRVGDFYEAFGEDAMTLSRALDLVVSSLPTPDGDRIAMSGIPVAAIDHYQRSLEQKGFPCQIVDETQSLQRTLESSITVATPADISNPSQPLDVLAETMAECDPHIFDLLSDVNSPDYSPSLEELRDWYSSAKGLGRISSYLDHIHVIGRKFIEQNPQAEANPGIRNAEFNLNDRDRNYLLRDTTAYQGQVTEFRSMATAILMTQGKQTENGDYAFLGRTYQIQGTPDNFTVKSQQVVNDRARGYIFSVESGEVAKARINQDDMQKFKGFVARVQAATPPTASYEYG